MLIGKGGVIHVRIVLAVRRPVAFATLRLLALLVVLETIPYASHVQTDIEDTA